MLGNLPDKLHAPDPACLPKHLKSRSTLIKGSFSTYTYLHGNLHIFPFPHSVIQFLPCSWTDADNFKKGSWNIQSACRTSHTFVTAVLPAAHICEQCFWVALARLSTLVSLLFFPGSRPGRSVAARLMSTAVLCMEAWQSQPRGSVLRCKLTCSVLTPHLPDLCCSEVLVRAQRLHYPGRTRSARKAAVTAPSTASHFTQLLSPCLIQSWRRKHGLPHIKTHLNSMSMPSSEARNHCR